METTNNEKEAFRLNRLEETNKIKRWASKLKEEKIKLYLFDNPKWLTIKEEKVLRKEWNKRKEVGK